jgi:Arm DNA-binding domain
MAPGAYCDGGGLYLAVSKTGTRKWSFRFTRPSTGRVTEMGLGSARLVALAKAREKAHGYRSLLRLEHAHQYALENHVHRNARMGLSVMISENWYNT